MKTPIALLVLIAATIAAFGLFVSNLAYAEQPNTRPSASFFSRTDAGPPAFALVAQAFGNGGDGNGLRNEVYRRNLGVNPDYGANKYYGPYYDQTGGYYGSIGQQCAWNGWVYFCNYNSESFY